jgi:glycosyltransferase involved in cell wall biosynthesis
VQTEKIRSDVGAKFPGTRLFVLPNGVDSSREKADGDSVVFLGNLHDRKGVDVLVRAMEGVDSELLIIGDGPEREGLERLVRDKGLRDKVRFLGKVRPEEARRYMLKGRVFVLPSLIGEGLPNVILEAMSVGLPVVSTSISGIPDVVKDGVTGFVVRPGDVRALRDAMNKILKDGRLHSRMSRNTLKEVERYSWKSVADKAEKILESVSKGRS